MKGKLIFLLVAIFIVIFSLNFVSSTCWDKTQSTCTAANGCKWKNDTWSLTGWCEELSCWSLYSQFECTTSVVPGKNCTWQGGGTTYSCEKMTCWSLSGTNESYCTNNSQGLNCEWQNYCSYSGSSTVSNCPQINTQAACLNATGCSWGNCNERGCWSYYSQQTCNAGKDYNGRNCTWDTSSGSGYCTQNGCWKYNTNSSYCGNATGLNCVWKWNNCQEQDCYNWDFTNASTCINNTANLSCAWTGSYCNRLDCWSYNTQSGCQSKPGCLWKAYTTSGWCNEVNCWTWDSMNGGNKTICENNPFSMSCLWTSSSLGNVSSLNNTGWCYKNWATVGCSNKTTERDCMDTNYCWWQYANWNNPSLGGSCNEPGSVGGANLTNVTSILNDWNPGCYIFDMNATDCNNTLGCNYSSGNCNALDNDYGRNITLNGLNCSYINSSSLCNSLPVLSSCCAWQNGTCASNKLSTSCRDQMNAPPAGASFCEDYGSYENQQLCEQIAGSPWYMPCTWDNSTSKCKFKATDVFGNDSQSLSKIDNKLNCQAAGGKWIIENYCEESVSMPAGRCESKFDEEDNCDKACYACELKDSNGNSVNSTNAASACTGSSLGICEFTLSSNAPNGIGYCKSKEQFKKGIAGNCDSNCGDCAFKGFSSSNDTSKRPSYYCTNSKANSDSGGCKWIVDNSTSTGGYCINKEEKTCEDSCDRCKTQTDCSNTGRTAVANQTGSCKWQGSSTTGSCVANIGKDVEICWDGIDNTNDNLIDCADPGCYADSSCGLVSGDCFGWKTNVTCIAHNASCEWVIDKWGSWCDFKGSQCWRYNQNYSTCNAQTNCQWSNGTGTAWCEKDYSPQEICMGLTRTNCMALNTSGCNWTVDTWCSGSGNGTSWCSTGGGWCDHNDFKPKNCWQYSSTGSSSCNNVSGCFWKTDQYSIPHCEVNWSANCWQNTDSSNCNANNNCIWETSPQGGSGWCMNKADKCWSYSQSECSTALDSRCYWQAWYGYGNVSGAGGSCQSKCWNGSFNSASSCSASYGCVWKAENGWCEESAMQACTNSTLSSSESLCKATTGCRWKNPGWCDPKSGGFSTASVAAGGGGSSMGGDCYKYDGNRTLCTNKSIINISCGWSINNNPTCDVNWGNDCWKYANASSGCTAANGCWYKAETSGGYCANIMDQCWNNATYQSWSNPLGWAGNCSANPLCINDSWGCQARCSVLDSSSCTNATYSGKCKWNSGWCTPKAMNEMFGGMESGQAAPIGFDNCNEEIQASVDICGFGMRDMGDSYGFGAGMRDFSNSSVCNKEKLSSFIMGVVGTQGGSSGGGGGGMTNFGTERIGNGNDTLVYLVYLDTDGSTSGSCALSNNASAAGYEFRFKYTSQWNANTSKAVETFNAYKCESSDWKIADIKLSAWKTKMCSEIGGAMIAVKKSDLGKFPTLYDSTKDIRVYVATIGNTGDISTPSDSAGPGWTTPGSIDFEIANAFAYGTDTAKFENILKKGFVQGEDCFNTIDDDGDGSIDCNDWDCQYSSKCSGTGVNAAGYADTSSPLVTGVKIEEYPDSALVMYDTNKPTNGTLELYGYGDTQCLNKTNEIYDIGILKSSSIRAYKMWHTALIYETSETIGGRNVSINWPLVAGSTYNYKIRVCDSAGKCAVSRCSSLKTPSSVSKCAYCSFVTRIKAPTGWKVAYDADRNGVYEHIQGEVCGPNAGMKTNYTSGRKVNVKLYASDGTTYIELLNASLTKTALNDKVRTISSSGDIIKSSSLVGLSSETRDKMINNLHPEVCRVKIPVASGATCDRLYHCDDSGANCVDRTSSATLIDSANCVWQVPYCEFSTYKTSDAPGSSSSSGGGGGGGGGGGASVYTATNSEFSSGYTKQLAKGDKIKFYLGNISHSLTLKSLTTTSATINVSSKSQEAVISEGEEKYFELDDDGNYDLSVKLSRIIIVNSTATKAEFTIKKYSESAALTGGAVKEQEEKTELSPEEGKESEGIVSLDIVWIAVIAVVIIVGVIVSLKFYKKKKRARGY